MKQHLSTLGKQTLIYGAGGTALQAVGLVTLPVFARVFTPAQYGVLEVITIGLAATLLVVDLGLASSCQRSYFDYDEESPGERRSVIATAIVTAAAASVLAAVAVIVFRDPLSKWLLAGQSYTTLVTLAAVSIPLTVLASLLRQVMRLHFRAWHFAASASLSAVVTGGVGVALVLWTDAELNGVLIGIVAGNAVALAYGIAVVGKDAIGSLSASKLRTMLAFGIPLIPAAAALWGITFLDRVMLSRLADLADVGEYAVAARFATVVMLGVTAFGLAFSPFLLSLWSENPELERRVRSRVLTYLSVLLAFASLALALFARELLTIVAPNFTSAYQLVGILCLGVTFYGIANVVMAGFVLVRRTGLIAAYSLAAVAVNVLLTVLLIPPLAGLGAALAAAAGYGTLAAAYYLKAQRLYPTPYVPWKTGVVLLAAAALMPLGLLPLGVWAVALKLGGLGVFAAVLVLAGVIERPELEELVGMVRRALALPRKALSGTAGGT